MVFLRLSPFSSLLFYQGYGSHNKMMDPGHMEKNARLMENILDNALYKEVL
jgi:hypothetical protein